MNETSDMSSQPDCCPRCGGKPTRYPGIPRYDGDDHAPPQPLDQQCCSSPDCGLPCRMWQDWAAVKASAERLRAVIAAVRASGGATLVAEAEAAEAAKEKP